MPERAIFRQSAIDAYRRSAEKDVVPRLVTWPIVACLWVLLGLLIAAALTAWNVEVPVYVDAPGVVLAGTDAPQSAGTGTTALLFLPADRASSVRVGQPVEVDVGSTDTHARGAITRVDPGVIGPEEAGRRYRLGAAVPTTKPSVAAAAQLETTLPEAAYAGSIVSAKVEVGSERLLSLLPGLGRLLGGSS